MHILLDTNSIDQKIAKYPEWDYYDNALHAEIEFDNFKDCFSAMSRIAFECEALQHYPEWTNSYELLKITITTLEAGGVTQKDFDLVAAIEAIVEAEL